MSVEQGAAHRSELTWRKLVLLGDRRDVIRELVHVFGKGKGSEQVFGGSLWLSGDVVEFSVRQGVTTPVRLVVFGIGIHPWFRETLELALFNADHVVLAHVEGASERYVSEIREIAPGVPLTIVKQEDYPPGQPGRTFPEAYGQTVLEVAKTLIGANVVAESFPRDFPYLPETFSPCYEGKVSGAWGWPPKSAPLRSDIAPRFT